VLFEGVSENSYQKVCARFNRQVRQEQSISPSSLQYEAVQEGRQLEEKQAELACKELASHYFDDQVQPIRKQDLAKGSKKKLRSNQVELAYEQVKSNAPAWLEAELELNKNDYEAPASTVYIGIDDVCNKRQKDTRPKKKDKDVTSAQAIDQRQGGKKYYKKRKFVFHTVAKIVAKEGQYTLTAPKISMIWAILIGFLLGNQLLKRRWIFLVDGQRVLHDYLIHHLRWRKVQMILDWYHLRKKIHRQMFMALKTLDQRDEIMWKVEQLAWHGLTTQAISLLKQSEFFLIKNHEALNVLITYFERNEKLIPNYAMRKKIGLVCSSNGVEKENDFIISSRQKHNGMSWTRNGSDALAQMAVIKRNKELDCWLDQKQIDFKLTAAA
jgi:hypothetical protein